MPGPQKTCPANRLVENKAITALKNTGERERKGAWRGEKKGGRETERAGRIRLTKKLLENRSERLEPVLKRYRASSVFRIGRPTGFC